MRDRNPLNRSAMTTYSPSSAMVKIVLTILVAELLIMLVIEGLLQAGLGHGISPLFWNIADPILLAVIVAPVLHVSILRPMQQQQQALEQQKNELRIASAALDSQAGSLREAQRIGGVGSFDIDVAKDRWTGTDQLETIYGIDANYARDFKAWTRLIHVDDRRALIAYCLNVIKEKSNLDREFRIIRANDGAVRWIHGVGKVLYDASGKTQRVVGTAQDITERKWAEAEVRKLSRAVDQSSASVMITDIAGNLEYVNRRFEMNTGYASAEVLGANPRFLKSGRTPSATYREMWELLAAGEEWRGEVCNRRKDGSLFWEHLVTSALKDENGRVTHYIAVKEDITVLQQAKQAAEAANVAKSHFLATMSHEIRTPMNAILGMAQVLLMPNIAEAERLDYVRTILGSGQTLLTLLNDILDLSKIEAGKVELESIAMEPGQVVGETRRLFAEIARAKSLRIETDWSGAPGRYLGDPHRLRQMLSNLAGNAVKFTEQGYVRIEAREVERDAGTAVLEFSVADTGIGIAQDEQALLFQAFSQTDSSITRNYGGSGLGLSIVASMARLMGGEAGVESEAGRGSRFWFRIRAGLPVADAHSGEAQPFPSAGAGAVATRFSGRVLVVEDNPENRKVIGVLLHKLGLGTVLAEDGQQALEAIARGEAADLILMDVHMPRMDGYAATAAIRRQEQESGAPRRPIIALSADAFDENRERCLAAGMDGVLTKPIALDALQAALAKWLPAAAPSAAALAAPAAAAKPVDIARVAALVAEILPLLARNEFDAIERFRALQEILAGTHAAEEIKETGRLVAALRFDQAQEHLRRMASAYAWGKTA